MRRGRTSLEILNDLMKKSKSTMRLTNKYNSEKFLKLILDILNCFDPLDPAVLRKRINNLNLNPNSEISDPNYIFSSGFCYFIDESVKSPCYYYRRLVPAAKNVLCVEDEDYDEQETEEETKYGFISVANYFSDEKNRNDNQFILFGASFIGDDRNTELLFLTSSGLVNVKYSGEVQIICYDDFYKMHPRIDAVIQSHDHKDSIKSYINVIIAKHGYLYLEKATLNSDYKFDLDLYNDSFRETYSAFLEYLQSNQKGLSILNGLPGTGKSTFIKHLCDLFPEKIVYVDSSTIASIVDPSFSSFARKNLKHKILIVEDSENIVVDHTENRSSITSNVLNITDGLLGDMISCKVILTFNCDISKIDPALLRPGRLKFRYTFDKLSPEDIKRINESKGTSFELQEKTLAELFQNQIIKVTEKKNKIGFG